MYCDLIEFINRTSSVEKAWLIFKLCLLTNTLNVICQWEHEYTSLKQWFTSESTNVISLTKQ